MNKIADLKEYLESKLHITGGKTLLTTEQIWVLFKVSCDLSIEDASDEEIAIGLGFYPSEDESHFMVYLGRIIDAKKEAAWQTTEIYFYLGLPMTQELSIWLKEHPGFDPEINLTLADNSDINHEKRQKLFQKVDSEKVLWEQIGNLIPDRFSYEFFVS